MALGDLSSAWRWIDAYRSWPPSRIERVPLLTEGKISLTVMTTLKDSILILTGQLVDEVPGRHRGALVMCGGGPMHTGPPPLSIE